MSNMPDMLADNATKDSAYYGLQYAKYIDDQWMHGVYELRRSHLRRARSHQKGTVDASHLKPLFKGHGDLSSLSINWRYQSPMSKFVTSIVEGFSYDMFLASVIGVDMYSQKNRSDTKRHKMKEMYGKEANQLIKEQLGYSFDTGEYIPSTREELDLYFQLDYKMAHEIALEIGIAQVYNFNDWRETFNKIVEDLSLCGVGVAHVSKDYNKGVNFRYVDPEYFLYSRDNDLTRDKKGSYYFAEIRRMTLADVQRESRGQLTDKQIAMLSGFCSRKYTTWDMFTNEELEYTLEVMSFSFKANRYSMNKKKTDKFGRTKYVPKDDYWHPSDAGRESEFKVPYEVWYEGLYILDTDICFNYRLVDGIMRDPTNARKALPPYTMYELSTEPIASKIMDIADDIYVVGIKLRNLIMKLRPKGYAIDIDGLNTIDLGDGTKLSPMDRVRIFNEDGSLLYSGSDLLDQGQNGRPPIHDLPDGTGQELMQLLNVRTALIQDLHEATGISQQATGSAPPSRTSAATYQGTLNTSQRVVNNIFNGLLSIQKRTAESIVATLISISKEGGMDNIVKTILGEYTFDVIAEIANIHNFQYSINIDTKPSNEERQRLVNDLTLALETKTIDLEDKIDIEMIKNVTLALQMIKLRQKDKRKREDAKAEIEHKRNLEAIQSKAISDLEKVKQEKMADAEAKLILLKGEAELESYKSEARLREISLTKQWDLRIAEAVHQTKFNGDKYKEDRKDTREEKKSEHQSRLIDQRQNNGMPQTFTKPEGLMNQTVQQPNNNMYGSTEEEG
jgi:hypothetical protein